MARYPLKLPPDDITEWYHIPVPQQMHYASTRIQPSMDHQMYTWLQTNTTGPYYIKSHSHMIGHRYMDVYCFRESNDAVMFSMMWG